MPTEAAILPEETASQPPSRPQRLPRDATFDILKGIGITEVILHHVLGFSARKYAAEGTVHWWALSLSQEILHFAVPTFLMASALLLARSLASKPKPDWKRFYLRRGERTLWPYLFWSLLYLAFRLWVSRTGEDMYPKVVSLPFVGTRTLPMVLADGAGWRSYLFWGKAYFHLYFMAVLLQFSLIFPLCYIALRRIRLGFSGVLLVSALLQGICFYLQARFFGPVLGFTTPGSSILWYIPSALIGSWLGLNWEQWPRIWKTWRVPLALLAFAGFSYYIALTIRDLRGQPIASLPYNTAYSAYSTGISLLLLAAAQSLARGSRAGKLLARIGEWSLPLFLIHPLFIFFLSGPRVVRVFQALPLSALWAFVILFALTWGLTVLTARLRLDRLLFGRSLTPSAKGQDG